jgi:Osmosensitive K+ channel histidine kinase
MDNGDTESRRECKVEVEKKNVHKYKKAFSVRFSILIMLCLLLSVTISALVFVLVFGVELFSPDFWGGVSIMTVGTIASLLVVQFIVLKPVRDMMSLLDQMSSNEIKVLNLPDSKLLDYEGSGFKDAMKYIHGLKIKNLALEQQAKHAGGIQAPRELTKALDLMNIGVMVLDDNYKISYHNKLVPIAHNLDGDEVLNLRFDSDDTLDGWLEEVKKTAIKAEKNWQRIPGEEGEDGKRKYYDVMASFNRGGSSEVVVTLLDQTSVYLPEESDLNFIAFAAHELRGPITIIRGYLDVLNDELADQLNEDHKELLGRLVMSSNRLSSYINNILNTSRYDQSHLQLILEEEKLSDIFASIEDDVTLRATTNKRILRMDIPSDLPTIAADSSSLSEVFTNIIDNAIKYSYEDGIVSVTTEQNGDNIEVRITDRGVGIPGNLLPYIFKKFYRSHRSRETVAGTGIGLYISKAIVESHGGKISVQSVEGKGSTFIISLPVYSSIEDKLKLDKGDNYNLIKQSRSDELIKNHGIIRG